MANDDLGNVVGQLVNKQSIIGAFDVFIIIFAVVCGLVVVALIIFIILKRAQYKHNFIRKIITGGTPIIKVDKAKEFTDKKTGTIYWKLLNAKHTIARPPSEALHPTDKGNYSVEAYYLGDINYHYLKNQADQDTVNKIVEIAEKIHSEVNEGVLNKFRDQVIEVQKKRLLQLWNFKPTPIYIYTESKKDLIQDKEAITTNQRLIAYDEIKTAYERKQGALAMWLPTLVSVGALIFLVVVVIVFGNDLIKPMIELNNANAATTESIAKIAQQLDTTSRIMVSVIQDRQIMLSEQTRALLNATPPN
jgi:hypothetical protein